MKKVAVFFALLVIASFSACSSNDKSFGDAATVGTWRLSYLSLNGDESTLQFSGYVFTFKTDGSLVVARPGNTDVPGSWNEFSSNTRVEFTFADSGLLSRLVQDWVIDSVDNTEILLHELGHPLNQFELVRR